MAIRILKYKSRDESVSTDLIIDTVERNRDRIRTIANMSLTLSGIMISASTAFVLFAVEKKIGGIVLPLALAAAGACFFLSATISVYSSLLRTKYGISSEAQFVEDLLSLYYSELRLLRVCFFPLILGFAAIITSLVLLLAKTVG